MTYTNQNTLLPYPKQPVRDWVVVIFITSPCFNGKNVQINNIKAEKKYDNGLCKWWFSLWFIKWTWFDKKMFQVNPTQHIWWRNILFKKVKCPYITFLQESGNLIWPHHNDVTREKTIDHLKYTLQWIASKLWKRGQNKWVISSVWSP